MFSNGCSFSDGSSVSLMSLSSESGEPDMFNGLIPSKRKPEDLPWDCESSLQVLVLWKNKVTFYFENLLWVCLWSYHHLFFLAVAWVRVNTNFVSWEWSLGLLSRAGDVSIGIVIAEELLRREILREFSHGGFSLIVELDCWRRLLWTHCLMFIVKFKINM